MSLITDIRAVSGNLVEQLTARFSGLPRPVLAAIGASDMAAERLAELREVLSDSLSERVSGVSGISAPSIDITDVRSAAADLGSKVSDLPSRAQKVAADVAGGIEQFASEAPAKAQEFIAQMPEKFGELQAAAQSLSPDAVRETFGAYSHLAGLIYGNLADRGDKTWTKVRSSGVHPGAVVEAVAAKARPAAQAAAKVPARAAARVAAVTPRAQAAPMPAAPRAAAPKAAAPKAAAPKAAAPKAAAPKAAAPKAAAPKAAAPKAAAPKAAAPTAAAPKPAGVKPAAAKPAPTKRPAGKVADKVVPKVAPKFVAAKQTVRKSGGRETVMPVVETVVITPTVPLA